MIKKKKMIIIGGGISGLSLRYFLTRKYSDMDITLLEKEPRLGGVIESSKNGPFFFEQGPRTFKASKSMSLLKLILDLGMGKDILVSNAKTARRFLWKGGKLHPLPMSPFSLLTSSLTRKLIPSLMKEWKQERGADDESIHSFATRRLGLYAANVFFDPMTLGIYAGDIQKLSVVSCFPTLKEMEKKYGSLTKGFFKKRNKKKGSFSYPEGMKASSLFTLREGVESLIMQLSLQGSGDIHLDTPIDQVEYIKGKVRVSAGERTWEGDHVFCALSAKGGFQLTKSCDETVHTFFEHLETVSLTVIQLGFQKKVLNNEGFGYLIPSSEGEKILGVIFDSSVFPEQNRHEIETRLTVMMGGVFDRDDQSISKEKRIDEALVGIRHHLGVQAKPIYTNVIEYAQIIPQYTVGHQERVANFQKAVKQKTPYITYLGNYLSGVSLSDCIADAELISNRF